MSLHTESGSHGLYPFPAEPVRPVIGISGAPDGMSAMCMMQMIHWAGAVPLLLCEHQERAMGSLQLTILKDIARIHGLIIMGDESVRDEASAAYEDRMIETAMKTRLPLLGIGAGMERIDALCGGTLHRYHPDLSGAGQPAAISHCDQFMVGVQWDPQHGASEIGQAILGSFTEQARAFLQEVV